MAQKFGGRLLPTGTPSVGWSFVVVISSLLAGASVVHNIYKPNLNSIQKAHNQWIGQIEAGERAFGGENRCRHHAGALRLNSLQCGGNPPANGGGRLPQPDRRGSHGSSPSRSLHDRILAIPRADYRQNT
ncbi:hypothetical protein SDJN03_07606, partial [Cucurbita argyrosperma subsp. sororia]